MIAVDVVPSTSATDDFRSAVLRLCTLAYGKDVMELFATLSPEAYVVARDRSRLLSHGMWVTRWLQPAADVPIRTAYVEFVATHPEAQRRGLASAVMERIVAEVRRTYTLAALSPATDAFYERLGWSYWLGPLSVRTASGDSIATPEERVMILRLRPDIVPDVTQPLSVEWREGELW
jgi:GNAT superfamily N-acetyltransferase